jgi:hypothetical protein
MSQFETFIASMEQYKNSEGTYDISIDKFREFMTKGVTFKRPQSGYFLWLNKERQGIREKYFSDYESISEWDSDTLNKYYTDKELGTPKREGKPKIVALVTTKAGILWKGMTVEEKEPYMEKAKMLKEEYSKIKSISDKMEKSKTETKTDTKTKTKTKAKTKQSAYKEVVEDNDNDNDEDGEDDNVDVEEYEYKDKTYYYDEKNNVFYDPETSKKVAKLVDGVFTFD